MPTLLVVDDEPSVLQVFRRKFTSGDTQVVTAENAADGLKLAVERQVDVAVLDLVLPDRSGLEVFRELQATDAKLPVIFMTALGTSDTAIEAMKLGALDYLTKPLDIGRVATQNVTVLIRGKSGTGKELIARALYHHSDRADGSFMEVNSAAIPEALLESELFGHEKGAFTGADKRRIGKFEQCNGGTLFLDEIGDMPPTLQSKMLRVLQEQRFERVGGNETIQTDVRVIAATNRNLERMVEHNEFRIDLYYRLNGFTISLPPLRQRADDLLLLIDHFLARANRDHKKDIRGVAPAAIDLLKRYRWPGNIRELNSVLRQAVLQTTGPVLLAEFLPQSVRSHDDGSQIEDAASSSDYWDTLVNQYLNEGSEQLYDGALAKMETEVFTRVLRHTCGNQVDASKILGVSRTTLRSKMRQLGITIDSVVQAESDED